MSEDEFTGFAAICLIIFSGFAYITFQLGAMEGNDLIENCMRKNNVYSCELTAMPKKQKGESK